MDPIYTNLQKERLTRKMTQTQLSELLGLGQSYLSQLERGQHDIKVSTLTQWSRALDLEVVLVPKRNLRAVNLLLRKDLNEQAELPPAYEPLPDEV